MSFTIYFYFIRSVILFLLFKLLAFIKINYIFSCFSSSFTLFNGSLPIIFNSSLLGKLYILYTLSYKNFLYKLPGLFNIVIYLLLLSSKKNLKTLKKIIILLFVIFIVLFAFLFNNTIIYGIPWFFCINYIVINIKQKPTLFDSIFISTWFAHAIGTIIYGLLNGFLSINMYTCLLPIAILERSLFVVTSLILFYFIDFCDFQLKKIFEIILKKKIILEL